MKKILVQVAQGANYYIRQSLVNAWKSVGYNVYFWNDAGKSAFDIFQEFPPDIFLSSTWQLSRALVKCLINNKPKTILYADTWQDKIDLSKYPVGTTTQEHIDSVTSLISGGVPFELISNHGEKYVKYTHEGWSRYLGSDRSVHSVLVSADLTNYYPQNKNENYQVEIAYVGGFWPFKGRNLSQYILPLTYPTTKWKVRIFGSGWNTVNCLGNISDLEAANYYTNAKIIPHIVEPHCSDIYQDLPLRYFQVPACRGFAISCPCVGIRDLFDEDELVVAENPKDFFDKVLHYLNHPEDTIPIRHKAMNKVFQHHTGLHRIKQLHEIINEDSEPIDKFIKDVFYPSLIGVSCG